MSGEGASRGEVNYNAEQPPVDNKLITAFAEWLRESEGISTETAEYYAKVVNRGEWPPEKRAHKKAWRKYIKFLAARGLIDHLQKMSWLDALAVGKYRPQLNGRALIPDEEVLEVGRALGELGLTHLFIIGLGGARLSHIVKMLSEWRPDEVVQHEHGLYEPRLYCEDGWCRYYLGIEKGYKKCYYVYYPHVEIHATNFNYRKLKDRIRKRGGKYNILRKWAEQQLTMLAHQHNIPTDAIKLIMSRGLSVSGRHYLNTRDWSDKLFAIYVNGPVKRLLRGLELQL